jgi:GDP/UDP-N,N'-diacetylbacillosamine 2-epimerase (hydrolysing)
LKILIITSTRADFGLLKNLIVQIRKLKYFKSKLLVTGSHLSKRFGYTVNDIKNNNIFINKKIKLKNMSNQSTDLINDTSKLSIKLSRYLKKENPNLVLILGDRFEILNCALVAYLNRISIAHIQGGEVTMGSLDDSLRHCISKLSSFHFVAHTKYKKRLIQLGEKSDTIFVVGGLGAENIKKNKLLSKKIIEKKFKFKFKEKNIIVNIQPVTNNAIETKKIMDETLKALSIFKDCLIIFTYPGVDLENGLIIKKIKKFVRDNDNSLLIKSFGDTYYYSFLNNVDFMIGNSSSGILEMPSFNKYTINIGTRQLGRLQAKSISNIKPNKEKIISKIKNIYLIKKIKKTIFQNPYYKYNTTSNIISILKKLKLQNIKNKKFIDIKF